MYKRIMVVVDQRPVTRVAVAEGVALAKVHRAEIVFFSVLPTYPLLVADAPVVAVPSNAFRKEAKANADQALAAARRIAEREKVASSAGTGSGTSPAHCIADAARRRRCDLVVVATEGRNALLRLLTGSVIPGLITFSHVPVLVCKAERRRSAQAKGKVVPLKRRPAARRLAAAA